MPHGGYDEEDYIATVDGIRVVMEEGGAMNAKDFLLAATSTSSSNSRVGARTSGVLTVLTCTALTGLNAAEVAKTRFPSITITLPVIIEGLQMYSEKWSGCGSSCGMPHLACLEIRIRKQQIDCVMGPRDLQSTTWNLNKTRMRTWDHKW